MHSTHTCTTPAPNAFFWALRIEPLTLYFQTSTVRRWNVTRNQRPQQALHSNGHLQPGALSKLCIDLAAASRGHGRHLSLLRLFRGVQNDRILLKGLRSWPRFKYPNTLASGTQARLRNSSFTFHHDEEASSRVSAMSC